jgi:DNA primase
VTHNGEAIEYIEVTRGDIALANELAHEVLGRSLDELPPQTRHLLEILSAHVTSECERLAIDPAEYRFTQRAAREISGWSDFQVKTHVRKLVEMEYLLVHRGGRGQSFVYELLWRGEGTTGKPFLMGLADARSLADDPHVYDSNQEHPKAERERSGSSEGAAGKHGWSDEKDASNASADAGLRFPKPQKREKTYRGLQRKNRVVRADGNGRAEA